MNKLLGNFLLLICYGCLLMLQPTHTLRIKRADSLANATDNSNNNNNNNIKANLTDSALPALVLSLGTVDKPQVKIMDTAKAAVAATANATESSAAATATAAAAAAATKAIVEPAKKLDQLDEAQANELAAHLHRGKRRMSLVEDLPLTKPTHHQRHHGTGGAAGGAGGTGGGAAPPYVYFNKMVSPDGKQELKEFQLLAPNVVIESVQHDLNYGPGPGNDLGGVLLLNADNNLNLNGHLHALGNKPGKHHHKHKSSLALPPFLFLLQQMLQPNLNLDLEQQRNRLDAPLYQLVDSAVDSALRNNHEIFERLINDRDIELADKDKEKDKDKDGNELLPLSKLDEKPRNVIELANSRKEDELVVSCPIHHDHHANNNGEIVDDDVVLVNECHIV